MDAYLKYVMVVLSIALMGGVSPNTNPLDLTCANVVMNDEIRLMSAQLEDDILRIFRHRYRGWDKWDRDEIERRVITYRNNMRYIREIYIYQGLKIPYNENKSKSTGLLGLRLTAHNFLLRVTGQTPYFVTLNEHSGLPLVDLLLVQDVFMYMITMALHNLYTVSVATGRMSRNTEIDFAYLRKLSSIAHQYLERIRFLFSQNANPDLYTEELTYLMWASAYGLDHLVGVLIYHGADVQLRSGISDERTFFANATALEIANRTLKEYILNNDIHRAHTRHDVYRYTNWRHLAQIGFNPLLMVRQYNWISNRLRSQIVLQAN